MQLRTGLTGAGRISIMMMPPVTAIVQRGDVTQIPTDAAATLPFAVRAELRPMDVMGLLAAAASTG